MTDDLQQARIEAAMRACVLSPEIPTGQRAHLVHLEGVLTIREQVDLEVVVEKVLAAADAVAKVPPLHRGEMEPVAANPLLRGVDLAIDRLVRRDCFTDRTLRVLDELREEITRGEVAGDE